MDRFLYDRVFRHQRVKTPKYWSAVWLTFKNKSKFHESQTQKGVNYLSIIPEEKKYESKHEPVVLTRNEKQLLKKLVRKNQL